MERRFLRTAKPPSFKDDFGNNFCQQDDPNGNASDFFTTELKLSGARAPNLPADIFVVFLFPSSKMS
jgi:hypothetical protein